MEAVEEVEVQNCIADTVMVVDCRGAVGSDNCTFDSFPVVIEAPHNYGLKHAALLALDVYDFDMRLMIAMVVEGGRVKQPRRHLIGVALEVEVAAGEGTFDLSIAP